MNTLVNINGVLLGESERRVSTSVADEHVEGRLCTGPMKDIYEDILFILENKKVYLDANINLTKLSRMLHTNTTYLSKVTNICFGCNFKTLLNKYRINYAKVLLKENECDIRQLPARCGFLSRSTFYAAFAKFEQTTPKDYRAKYLSMMLRQENE